MNPLFTIGHSNHSLLQFIALLQRHHVDAVADVRSNPISRLAPHFDKRALKEALAANGIQYAFLGKELGARRSEPEAYEGRIAAYERIARLSAFREGLARVAEGVRKYRIALMCAERDPLQCHRTILICQHLRADFGDQIYHILASGELESHADAENRLLEEEGMAASQTELFDTIGSDSALERAYRGRGLAIAWQENSVDENHALHDRVHQEDR